MPCENPLRAYRSANGGRPVFFKKSDPQYWVDPYDGLLLPCGSCLLCRKEQSRQWAIRLMHEASHHEANCFMTLTYDDKHKPPNGGLCYEDLQKFWKRLRKNLGELRYYAVGEYGDKTLRPHYHACVFGMDFTDDRIIVKREPYLNWFSPTLERAWGLGTVQVGALTHQTASYVAGYVHKKINNGQRYVRIDEETGELIKVEQPRAFMSKNLGKDWWNNYKQGTIDHDRVIVQGNPQKPPRAYDKWLSEVDKATADKIKARREERVSRIVETEEQRRARAHNARAHEKRRVKSV